MISDDIKIKNSFKQIKTKVSKIANYENQQKECKKKEKKSI